jgi:hypothetical protein
MVEITMAQRGRPETGAHVLPVTRVGKRQLGMIRGENKTPSPWMERHGDCNVRSKYYQYNSDQDSGAH